MNESSALFTTNEPDAIASSTSSSAVSSLTQSSGAVKTEETALSSNLSFEDLSTIPDLICFSHLRWDFVFQRPQHLLTRFAAHTRVYFIEEPLFDADQPAGYLEVRPRGEQLMVLVPHLLPGCSEEENDLAEQKLVQDFIRERNITSFIGWYYTPMALGYSRTLQPAVTVYDCMDELSAFAGAHPLLLERERELYEKADLVFTGGQSLYEAKKDRHPRVFAFPSSIERQHFAKARTPQADPEDQAGIPHPRMGFFGVVDERMDIQLLGEVARLRPDWHLVVLGPFAKIDPEQLPRPENIHYLGMKSYQELPAYIGHWEVALLPFALNESTKFISPTKTPEYLASGKPVVSTPITDVVRPYGELELVQIARTPEEFVTAIELALQQAGDQAWLNKVDQYLSQFSWDHTWAHMTHLICQQLMQRERGE